MRRLLFIILTTISTLNLFATRQVVNINKEWQFTPGWEINKGVQTEVNLPHTWNLDALSGRVDYYRGLGGYVKHIQIPHNWANKRLFIRFKGSNQTTSLYVNGKNVGTHKGGYTAFTWDITPFVKVGERNIFWVRVNNAPDLDVMPLVGDFNVYGGIYRDVDLIVTSNIHIDMENLGSSGVFVTPANVSEEKADVTVQTSIVGVANSEAEVLFAIRDADNKVVDSLSRIVLIGANGRADVSVRFNLKQPKLWHGTENPYMYKINVTVTGGKRSPSTVYDELTQNFGIRYFEINRNNQFLLNGKPYTIRGVVKHQDWAGLGGAIHPTNHDRDMEMMLDMGVNAVRLANHPSDPYFIELCDRAGVIVWSEMPFAGPGGYRDKGFNDSDAFRANGEDQLREMIRQLYNHPSIMFWGLYNELIQNGDDPVPYLKELNVIVKEEDPTRLTVAASDQNGDINFITDVVGFNKYSGWSTGRMQDVAHWSASLRRDWSKLRAGISAYGAGASIYQQSETITKPAVDSYWHPEQWQTHYHEHLWKIISEKPNLWGAFVFSMFDSGVAHRTEGQIPGVNDKGLVTFDRAFAKDAYYFYKANWNTTDPFVYIAERRLQTRTGNSQTIKVYSNQPQVEILINGVEQGGKKADGSGIFLWKITALKEGDYVIEAFSGDCDPDKTAFKITKPILSLAPVW